jgi:hypothetical protein
VPFFMVDDQFQANRKVHALIDMGPVGLQAIGLWTVVGSLVQAQLADGEVPTSAWRQIGNKPLFTKLAKILVNAGLWEEHDDAWRYHDWEDIGYAPGEKVKLRRARTKEMKNPDIVEAVKARDGDHCRYCKCKINWKDKVGDNGATYDHVIPGLAKGVSNLVVACRKCNRKKAQRTPEQAGMTLLPPPNGPDSPDQVRTKSGPSPDQVRTKSGPSPDQVPDQVSASPLGTRSRARSKSKSGEGDDEATAQGHDWVAAVGPAGRAPDIPLSEGHTGSPFHNWSGPPAQTELPQCPEHDLELPCRKCTAGHYAGEATA